MQSWPPQVGTWQGSGTALPGMTWSHSHTPGTYAHAHTLVRR